MKKRIIATILVLVMVMSVFGGIGSKNDSKAAIVDDIPIQIGELVKGRWDAGAQDGYYIYYSFTTTDEKAFYSVSLNSNYNGYWSVCKETDTDTALREEDGTDTIDLGNALKPSTKYYVILKANSNTDEAYEFRVSKYVDDIGDDRSTCGQIQMNTEYTYNIENGTDQDCFEFNTGNTDYILTVSTISGVHYNIYKDDLLTVPIFSYSKEGTKVLDLTGVINRDTKYWIAFWGSWSEDYETQPYTFKFETTFNLDRPSVNITSKKGRKIKLSWISVPDASGYEIYRGIGYGSSYKKIKTIAKTSWTSKKQKKNRTYYYKVYAYINYGGKKIYSEGSNEVYKTFY